MTYSEFSGRRFLTGVFLGCLLVCLSWAWLGMVFAYSVLPTPPLSVGAGLGNRATHLWHRTRFPSSRLGFRCLLTSSVIFFFSSFFYVPFSLSLHLPRPPPSRVTWRWFFVDDFFLPLKATLTFILVLRTLPASLLCRSEVWEWVLGSRIFDSYFSCGIGVSINFP